MKRLGSIVLPALLALSALTACAPPATFENNVVPTLISVDPNGGDGDEVVLVGRYFGDGEGGAAADSYVVVGAYSDCTGGVRIRARTWSHDRITFTDPGAGAGFVCVVSGGVSSNPLTANLD